MTGNERHAREKRGRNKDWRQRVKRMTKRESERETRASERKGL